MRKSYVTDLMLCGVGNRYKDCEFYTVQDNSSPNETDSLVKLNDEWYLLNGWNGEEYAECWKYKDKHGYERADKEIYSLVPVQIPDTPGDFENATQWQTIGFVVGY